MPRTPDHGNPAPIARYIVERYWPGLTLARLEIGEGKLRSAADRLTMEGRPVRYLGSTFLTDEETAFAVFEAADPAWVEEVNRLADQPFDRIVPVVDLRESERLDLAARPEPDRPPRTR